MIINGKSENQLSIKAEKPVIDKANYIPNLSFWSENRLLSLRSNYKENYRTFKCGFAILGENEIEKTKNASKFIEIVKNCTIEYKNFIYDLDLQSQSITPYEYDLADFIELNFNIVDMYESEKSVTTTTNTAININSPKQCYANLEISAKTNVISCIVKINDTEITVNNIKGGETIYIGSGKVIAGNKSKMNDVDMWEFPKLNPGENIISVNREDVNLTIKYCERW